MNENFENDFDSSKESSAISRYFKFQKENRSSFFDVEDFSAIIDHCIQNFDLHKAKVAIEGALEQHPKSFEISLRKARLSLLKGNAKECLKILSPFEFIYPSNGEILLLKAEGLSAIGEVDKAIRILKRLLEKRTFDSTRLSIQLAELYTLKSNYLDAIHYWKLALQGDAENEAILASIRTCFEHTELQEEAVKYFNLLIDQNPYNLGAWFELGNIHIGLNEHAKAIKAYDYALAIDEDSFFTISAKATSLFYLERYHEALGAFTSLLEFIGDDSSLLCNIGECYEQLEEFERAAGFYTQAIALDAEHAEARIGYAITLEHLGESNKAIRQLETAVGLEPDNSEYWLIYAELLSRKSDFEKSQLCYERSIQLSENKLEGVLSQIDSLIRAERYGQALDKVECAFNSIGDKAEIYFRGIRTLYNIGKKDESLVLLEMLIDRHGNKEALKEYYPDIFEDSEALQLLKFD